MWVHGSHGQRAFVNDKKHIHNFQNSTTRTPPALQPIFALKNVDKSRSPRFFLIFLYINFVANFFLTTLVFNRSMLVIDQDAENIALTYSPSGAGGIFCL